MLRQDETDKPLIAIWIPEALEWNMLGQKTEQEWGYVDTFWHQTYRILTQPNS